MSARFWQSKKEYKTTWLQAFANSRPTLCSQFFPFSSPELLAPPAKRDGRLWGREWILKIRSLVRRLIIDPKNFKLMTYFYAQITNGRHCTDHRSAEYRYVFNVGNNKVHFRDIFARTRKKQRWIALRQGKWYQQIESILESVLRLSLTSVFGSEYFTLDKNCRIEKEKLHSSTPKKWDWTEFRSDLARTRTLSGV